MGGLFNPTTNILLYKTKFSGDNKRFNNFKYVTFIPVEMRRDVEVGYFSEKENSNSIATLYRICLYTIFGKKDKVDMAVDMVQKYYTDKLLSEKETYLCPFMYKALTNMPKSILEELEAGLKIECGVILDLDDQNKITLRGIRRNKALKMIYNHPLVAFELSKEISLYPKNWERNEEKIQNIEKIGKHHPFKINCVKVKPESEEFKEVSAYFYKGMNNKRFKITGIYRYQNPIKYYSYLMNLRNVQYKIIHSGLKSDNSENWNEYTPFKEFEKGEKWLYHVFRYQNLKDILGEKDDIDCDSGFLPIKTENIDIKESKNEDSLK